MLNRLDKYWLSVIVLLLLSIVCGSAILVAKQNSHQSVEISLSSTTAPQYQGEIYIGGAVFNPGLYSLRKDDSIESLIQAAGLTPDADPGYIELHVPVVGESYQPQRVSLNRAEVWLLEALPGIGQDRAQAIVDYRNRHGPFHRIDDLLKVDGIGNVTLDKIKALITVEG